MLRLALNHQTAKLPEDIKMKIALRIFYGFAAVVAAFCVAAVMLAISLLWDFNIGRAHAADLPRKAPIAVTATTPVFGPWAGWYIGFQGGYGYDVGNAIASGFDQVTFAGLVNSPAAGWTAGGRLGYDLAAGPFVIGFVTEINGANFAGSINGPTASGNYSEHWWGATNARIGLTQFGQHVLPYIIGGMAYGGRNASVMSPLATFSASDSNVGWDAGAGLAVKLSPTVDLFAEAKYVDLGTLAVTDGMGDVLATKAFRFGVIEGGVNFHFTSQ